jgi:tetratricopeptide (TPR) repeat protein
MTVQAQEEPPAPDDGLQTEELRTDAAAAAPPPPGDLLPDGEREDAYARAGQWAELVELLLSRAEGAEPEDAALLLRRAAQVLETRFGDPERAFVTLLVAFRHDTRNGTLLADLERLGERLGRLEELLGEAEAAMLEQGEPSAVADLWARVARWNRRLGRWDEAVTAAESALGVDPRHEGALTELEEGHRQLGQWTAVARLLGRRVRLLSQAGGRANRGELLDLQLELAALFEERLGDDDQALAACERALNLDRENEAALARLERLAERKGRRLLLVDVLGRRLAKAPTPALRRGFALRLAAEWERLGRGAEARAVLERLVAADPGSASDPDLLAALARLCAASGDTEAHVDVLFRQLAAASDPAARAALSATLGRLLLVALGREEEGEQLLVEAVALDPAQEEAAHLLADRWRQNQDWARLGDLLMRQGRSASLPSERIALLREAAAVYRDGLGDGATAREIWGWIVDIEPHNRDAVEALAAEAEGRRDWARVRAVLQPLVDRPGAAAPEARAAWHDALARAAAALGDPAQTLAHRREAARLVPQHHGYVAALAAQLYEQQRLAEAAPLYERLWGKPDSRWSDAERAEIAFRLGRTRLARRDARGAVAAFERALGLAPGHQGALAALAETSAGGGDLPSAARWKETQLRATPDPDGKIALAREIAHLYQHRLGAPAEAVRVLRETLATVPEARPLQHELLEIFIATKAWRDAVEVLLALADGETGPARAKYLVSGANVLAHHLEALDDAIDLYNRALDAHPEDLKTFERIDRLLTRERRFQDQERNYRMMLWRLRGRNDERSRNAQVLLWRGLGEIYRSRLGNLAAATAAFEVVARLDGDPTAHQILGELYELGGAPTYARAVDERRKLLLAANDLPGLAAQLRAVRRLALNMADTERAWRATDALVALDVADAEERGYHAMHTAELQLPEAQLPPTGWPLLLHRDEDPHLCQIFSSVGRALIAVRSRDPEGWGLKEQSQAERDGVERSVLGRLLVHMAGVLQVPRPHLQFRPDLPGTVDMAGVRARSFVAPTLVAGSDMLRVRSKRELVCVLSKKVALMRPEHYVLWPAVVPTIAELRVVLLALGRIFGRAKIPADLTRIVAKYERTLRRNLGPRDLERAAASLPALEAGAADVARWVRGAFFTSSRVGYLVAGDLQTSLRTATVESMGAVTLSPFEQLRDLVAWSLSDEHLALRRQLGLGPLRPALGYPEGPVVAARPPATRPSAPYVDATSFASELDPAPHGQARGGHPGHPPYDEALRGRGLSPAAPHRQPRFEEPALVDAGESPYADLEIEADADDDRTRPRAPAPLSFDDAFTNPRIRAPRPWTAARPDALN